MCETGVGVFEMKHGYEADGSFGAWLRPWSAYSLVGTGDRVGVYEMNGLVSGRDAISGHRRFLASSFSHHGHTRWAGPVSAGAGANEWSIVQPPGHVLHCARGCLED